MATESNLSVTLGATWEINFSFDDAAGNDLDLTGATVKFRVKRRGVLVLNLATPASEIGVNSPSGGNGVITITPADQAGLVPAVYEYEVRAILADLRVTTQAFGALTLAKTLF